ncbi:MAG TPA: DinB family protein [Gemmatimonadales bacterium]|nr:DinB family protein [Gemmatimonadales bacterium]
MTTFSLSNPAGGAASAAAEYTRAILAMLGDREPLGVLAELVPWLEARLRGISDERLRRPEAPDKWSAIEVVQHLADAELVAGWRVRFVLTQDRPPLPGFDQDAFARDLRYRGVPLAEAMGQLSGVRTANLRLYRSLGPAELERLGVHAERGPESVGHIIRMMAGHDLVHRRQLDRILA